MDIGLMAAQLLTPLGLAAQDRAHLWRLLADLGAATEVDDALLARFGDLVRIDDLRAIAELLAAASDPADTRPAGEIVGELIPLVDGVLAAIGALAELSSSTVDDLVAPLDDPSTWRDLALLLPEYLLGQFLDVQHPTLASVLALLATTREVELPDGDGYPLLDFAAIGSLLAGPVEHLRSAYRWGDDFDYPTLLDRLAGLGAATGWKVRRRPGDDGHDRLDVTVVDGPTDDGYARLVVQLGPALDGGGVPDGVALSFAGWGPFDGAAVGADWTIGAGADVTGVVAELRPAGVTLTGPAATVVLNGRPAVPWSPVGLSAGTRLELTEASLDATVTADDTTLVARLGDPGTGQGLRLVVGAGADSFLSTLIGDGLSVDTALAVSASLRDGIDVGGSAGMSVVIVVERTIGPVVVHRATFALRIADSGLVELVATVSAGATIGPISAAVDGFGLRALLVPATGTGGAGLGPYELAVAFQPPAGVGLGLDLGPVAGGGYLFLDPAAGSYAGVLELQILAIGVSAVGIIDTRAPDVDGWSMFFALYLSVPSIQLGFGFTLTGLGGLAGINRTVDQPALGAAVRAGALDAVLFPDDPIADAPYIIDQLQSMFPPAPDRYVFGPVVRIGWGTPSLIEAVVGVVISLPDPIAIVVLGSVTSVLPTEDLDIVAMRVDVAGSIDFGTGRLEISASLHDSHVLQFALSGDMELRAEFGDQPSFLMSLGGFHPDFDDLPDDFPDLRPLSLAVSASPVFLIHFDCYFALSASTVQFGSSFSISAEVEGFGIEGGSEFDALLSFSPFELRTHLGFHIVVRAAGLDLAGVWLDVDLTGPNPWYVTGEARFKVLGFEESVRVDQRIGTHRDEPALEPADLRDLLRTALAAPDAWAAADAPTGGGVVLAPWADTTELVVTPDGTVSVSQRAVPLELRLEKAGDCPVGAYHTFELEPTAPGQPVEDWFATGQFFELTPTEQLSAPSFDRLPSGVAFGGGDPVAGPDRAGTLDFEQILLDPELDPQSTVLPAYSLIAETRPALLAGVPTTSAGAIAVAGASPVRLQPTDVRVSDRRTGQVLTRTTSWSAAHQSEAGRSVGTAIAPGWEPS
jgi:hypothetical protein